jgi:hypothetical protein
VTQAGLSLLGGNLDTQQVRPGEPIYLTLFWRAERPVQQDYIVRLSLEGAGEEMIDLYQGAPVHGTYPTARWMAGEVVVDRYDARVPKASASDSGQALPGDYQVRVTLTSLDGVVVLGPEVLGQLTLQATQRSFQVPTMEHRQPVTLAGQVELVGYDLDLSDARPGGQVKLQIYWRALQDMAENYTVFVHVLGPQNRIVAQEDNVPASGAYPTTLWLPGEVVADPYTISLPEDLLPGTYPIQVGFYIVENGFRLADPVRLESAVIVSP